VTSDPASRLPSEVELVYEVMSCNAMRTAQEPLGHPHPCGYFRRWGTYHSYDYTIEGAPAEPGVVHESRYVGRAPLVPELLSGCRKAPIMAVGINPNLPGWWPHHRASMNPLFDDYRQYAHYFRYRAVDKVQLSEADYARFGGGPDDTPFSDVELDVPAGPGGDRPIRLEPAPQRMYAAYQALLDALAEAMGWADARLAVGEDLAYGNMVASPSARWTTKADPADPTLPPMTDDERDGIVSECFRTRRYFLRQLFQSLPAVLLVFSQNTANAFVRELRGRFSVGDPRPGEPLADLMGREVRLRYGDRDDGRPLDARVVFAPHVTGNPDDFAAVREQVVSQLVAEADAGTLELAPSGHLRRPPGACVFCPMLEIGPCDYVDELQPLSDAPGLTADSAVADLQAEKAAQLAMLEGAIAARGPLPVGEAWGDTDDEPALVAAEVSPVPVGVPSGGAPPGRPAGPPPGAGRPAEVVEGEGEVDLEVSTGTPFGSGSRSGSGSGSGAGSGLGPAGHDDGAVR
jgi:hypothetical protein